MTDVGAASELLKPIDARLMRCYPVSTRINHVANDDGECWRPVELSKSLALLFSSRMASDEYHVGQSGIRTRIIMA